MVATAIPLVIGAMQAAGSAQAQNQAQATAHAQQIKEQQMIDQQAKQEKDTRINQGQTALDTQKILNDAQQGPANAGFANMLLTGTKGLQNPNMAPLAGNSIMGI
jgi:Flp pilus assembly protein TadB